MIWLCDDADVIGSDFYCMDYLRGRSFWDQLLPGLEASEKKAIYAAMVSTLARLHRVDPAAVGLADLGRPDGYVSRQVERWTRQYRASEHTRIAPMEEDRKEHTSELQSLMRISYAVFCLKKKN